MAPTDHAPTGNGRPALGKLNPTFVTLKLGAKGKEFTLHKDILCQQSPYFRAAFSPHWKEGQEKVIVLDETRPSIFAKVAMDWFYTGIISNNSSLSTTTLVQTYVFADRYDVPLLRQAIIDLLHEYYTADSIKIPSYLMVIGVFTKLPPSSKLCQLFIDLYAARWKPHAEDENERRMREQLPTSFMVPLMLKLSERTPSREPLPKYNESGS